MADEIQGKLTLDVINGEFMDCNRHQFSYDQTGVGRVIGTVTVDDTESDVDLSELTTEGWVFLNNLSTTDTVEWGPKKSGSMIAMGNLKPGECAFFRMNSAAVLRMVVVSPVDPAKVEVRVYED